ncbi:5-guanidino-2-oxopentanoate decarboxylase (plasmid) [Rhodobacteraceae bacterium M382]|nr:5-guanidino-2-oxopentanoate decarboxylase [Rhodobacteraceae bacterium M382]
MPPENQTDTTEMTCGEALLHLLKAYGIDTAFGIPGYHTVEFYRNFDKMGIRQVTPRHEQGSAYGAYGYAAATGKPGVCFLVTGAGVTNGATAIGEAYSNSIPMLVFTTMNNVHELGMNGGRMHELRSQEDILGQVSAFTHTLLDAKNLPEVLARAFTAFNSGRPRPVSIQIPQDVLAGPAGFDIDAWPTAPRAGPDPEETVRITDMLADAKTPMIVVGGGAIRASDEVLKLAERLDAPVVNSCAGKGVIPEDHPLCLGFTQAFDPVRDMLRDADVVLAVGTEFAEPDRYFTADYPINGQLIRIDIDPGQLMHYSKPSAALLSDSKSALTAILSGLEHRNGPQVTTAGATRVVEASAQFNGDLCKESPKHKKALEIIHDVLPDNTIISADASQICYTGLYHYPMKHPNLFHFPNGYAAMGFGMPVAIGMKVGAGDRPVACITGDGSFQMTIEELAAAVEQNLSIPIVVWSNGGYQEIREYMDSKGLPTIGCNIYNPDFTKIAEAFGARGFHPQSGDELRAALETALVSEGPTIIEIDETDAWLQ